MKTSVYIYMPRYKHQSVHIRLCKQREKFSISFIKQLPRKESKTPFSGRRNSYQLRSLVHKAFPCDQTLLWKKDAIQNTGLSPLGTNVAQDRTKLEMVKQNLPTFLVCSQQFKLNYSQRHCVTSNKDLHWASTGMGQGVWAKNCIFRENFLLENWTFVT